MANEPETMVRTPESDPAVPMLTDEERVQAPVAGAVSNDELYQRLQAMPLDKLKSIITNQVDLEIRLKHKELALCESEIGKCESQMITLRKFFKIPSNVNFDNEPNFFTHRYSRLLSEELNANYKNVKRISDAFLTEPRQGTLASPGEVSNPTLENGAAALAGVPAHSYRTRSTTLSLRPPSMSSGRRYTLGCLYRRTDGIIVKLTCPSCSRSNFSSAQGFLNHSRIAHSTEYTSQDAAALQCGEILHEEEQDEEGLASLRLLRLKNMDPHKYLNVAEVHFDGLSPASINKVPVPPHSTTTNSNKAHQTINLVTQQLEGLKVLEPDIKREIKREIKKEIKKESRKEKGINKEKEERRKHNHLMKKMIEKGIANNSDEYDKLVSDAISEVKDSHLFNGEVEIEDADIKPAIDDKIEATGKNDKQVDPLEPRTRRKSRGGITKPEKPVAKDSNQTTMPKLKLKFRRP